MPWQNSLEQWKRAHAIRHTHTLHWTVARKNVLLIRPLLWRIFQFEVDRRKSKSWTKSRERRALVDCEPDFNAHFIVSDKECWNSVWLNLCDNWFWNLEMWMHKSAAKYYCMLHAVWQHHYDLLIGLIDWNGKISELICERTGFDLYMCMWS